MPEQPRRIPPAPRTVSDYERTYAEIALGYHQRLPKIENDLADISAAVIRIESKLSSSPPPPPMRDRAASQQDLDKAVDRIGDMLDEFTPHGTIIPPAMRGVTLAEVDAHDDHKKLESIKAKQRDWRIGFYAALAMAVVAGLERVVEEIWKAYQAVHPH